MPARYAALAAVAALLLVGGGFLAGRALNTGDGTGFAFDSASPAYRSAAAPAVLSKGGFSGFGETDGLEGTTILSGRVVSAGAEAIVIESEDGAQATIRLAGSASMTQIEASSADALRPGAIVVIRHQPGSDEALAVLVLE